MYLKVFSLLAAFTFLLFLSTQAHAGHYRNRGTNRTGQTLPVTNNTYRQECGACHFPYQPWLLPSGSWAKLLAQLPSHFGDEVEIDEDSRQMIAGYLRSSAMEYSGVKRARKMAKAVGNLTPLRITETPYFKQKHRELDPRMFTRTSIGSPSNCLACHTTAEQGVYDDDFVRIPQ